MKHSTCSEAICDALEFLGVKIVFGIPSQHNLRLYDALARRPSIRSIICRHEAGAVHAADGYARATGTLGVALVSTGPGTANAMHGLYEAGYASSPVLLITTQVDQQYLGRNKGFIHEAEGQLAMLRSVTRRTERVLRAIDAEETILSLATSALTGRPQPCAVEIPTDMLVCEAASQDRVFRAPAEQRLDLESLERVTTSLAKSKRPLLWLGGGTVRANAARELLGLVERLGIPFVTTSSGRSIINTDHPLHIGTPTHFPQFREFLTRVDLVIAIGTRFQAVPTWFWTLQMPLSLIHIDADPSVIGRNYPVEVAVTGDARSAAAWLNDHAIPPSIDAQYQEAVGRVRGELTQEMLRRMGADHRAICASIDRHLPVNRNIVCDATLVGTTWGQLHLPIRTFRGLMHSTGMGIGTALPLGIGAALGSGRKTVILHGDGGIMLSLGELATAAETRAATIILVFNDRGYGTLRQLQEMSGLPYTAVDLHTPNFTMLGDSMGLPSVRVESAEAFDGAFASAVLRDGPSLIEIDMSKLAPLRLT